MPSLSNKYSRPCACAGRGRPRNMWTDSLCFSLRLFPRFLSADQQLGPDHDRIDVRLLPARDVQCDGPSPPPLLLELFQLTPSAHQSGMGGGGNVDPYISAASSVALTATFVVFSPPTPPPCSPRTRPLAHSTCHHSGAASYFLICVPTFEFIGVKSLLLGGWTYALVSPSGPGSVSSIQDVLSSPPALLFSNSTLGLFSTIRSPAMVSLQLLRLL